MTLVTQNGIVKNQPGVCVSFTCPAFDWKTMTPIPGKVQLNVTRYYDHLPNKLGGRGVSKKCDHNGKLFNTVEEAKKFALEHGYLTQYFPK